MRYLAIVLAALPAVAADLPDDPAKSTAIKVCSPCHGLEPVVGLRRTRAVWESMVDDMAARGATATEPEFDAVVSYLVKFFGKANVNKADSKQIQEATGFSPEQADGIVSYRTRNGDFKGLQDLQKVPGLDAKILEEKRDRIAFE